MLLVDRPLGEFGVYFQLLALRSTRSQVAMHTRLGSRSRRFGAPGVVILLFHCAISSPVSGLTRLVELGEQVAIGS